MDPTVLVVSPSPARRARISAWLEEADLAVSTCPGPKGHTACVGMEHRCPLAEEADVVVLDPEGARSVLDVYLDLGVAAVVVGHPSEPDVLPERPGVSLVDQPAGYGSVVGAVRRALERAPGDDVSEGSG